MWFVSFIMMGLFTVVIVDCSIPTNTTTNLNKFKFDYSQSIDVSKSVEKISIINPNGDTLFIGTDDNRFQVEGKIYVKAKDKKEAEKVFKEYSSIKSKNDYILFEVKKAQNESDQYLISADLIITLPQEMMPEMDINK